MNLSRLPPKFIWLLPILFFLGIDCARAAIDTKPLTSSSIRIICVGDDNGTTTISTGSGFLVDKAGKFALTNSHVITDCQRIDVYSPRDSGDPKKTSATVRWNSKKSGKQNLDMALLEFEESVERTGVVFASKTTVQVQDVVIAVGYPGAADRKNDALDALIKPSITQGTVSRLVVSRDDDGQNGSVGLYQITAPIGPGNSGGPLFNEYGEVIGINTEKALIVVGGQRVPVQEGVAWSQEIDEVIPLLQEHHIDVQFREERRGLMGSWLHREPVTAGVLGLLAVLVLSALTVVMRRQPVTSPGVAPPVSLTTPPASASVSVSSRSSAQVIGVSGPYAGSRFPLDTDIVFGRDPKSCSVVFAKDQDGISSRHCSLRFDAARGDFELRDLGSANGTFVNGKQIASGQPARLRSGDEFYLFKSQYRFVVQATA